MIQISVSGQTTQEVRDQLVALLVSLPAVTLDPQPKEVAVDKPQSQAEPTPGEAIPAQDSAPVSEKTAERDYAAERAALRKKLSDLMAAGKKSAVNALVTKYAESLPKVRDEDLEALATEAGAM